MKKTSPNPSTHPHKHSPIREYSAGGIVFHKANSGYEFVLIKDGYRKWTFPKGKIEKGETPQAAALAEVEEEAGVHDPKIIGKINSIILTLHPKGKRPFRKKVFFFLIKTHSKSIKKEGGKPSVLDASWVKKDEVMNLLGYQNMKSLFSQALAMLKNLE